MRYIFTMTSYIHFHTQYTSKLVHPLYLHIPGYLMWQLIMIDLYRGITSFYDDYDRNLQTITILTCTFCVIFLTPCKHVLTFHHSSATKLSRCKYLSLSKIWKYHCSCIMLISNIFQTHIWISLKDRYPLPLLFKQCSHLSDACHACMILISIYIQSRVNENTPKLCGFLEWILSIHIRAYLLTAHVLYMLSLLFFIVRLSSKYASF